MFNRATALFLLITFSFSWSASYFIKIINNPQPMLKTALLFLFMCGPAIGALICTWIFDKNDRVTTLGLRLSFKTKAIWLWIGAAYLIPLLLIIGATALHLLSPKVGLQPPIDGLIKITKEASANTGNSEALKSQLATLENIPAINLLLVLQIALIAPLINFPFMLSEELGWRGWLWNKWRGFGFWKATLWTGFIWGLWHVPIIAMGHNYPGMPLWGPFLFIIMCIALAPAYSLIREKTGSVWGACLMHGTMNGAASLGFLVQTQTDMPFRGVVGIGGFVIAILIAVLIAVLYRPPTASFEATVPIE